jgi:hypothetical protein
MHKTKHKMSTGQRWVGNGRGASEARVRVSRRHLAEGDGAVSASPLMSASDSEVVINVKGSFLIH